MRVGLVAAPELPAQIAVDLAEQLPELLDRHHDGRWRVALAEEPLLAGREGVEEILDAGCQARSAEGWDAAICLTDVPLRDGARPLVAAVDRDDKVAVVNIPAFGATLLKPRVRKAAIALIGDIAEEALEGPNQLKGRRPTEVLTPIRRETAPDARADVRYVMPAGPRASPAAERDGAGQPPVARVQRAVERGRGGLRNRRLRAAEHVDLAAQRRSWAGRGSARSCSAPSPRWSPG